MSESEKSLEDFFAKKSKKKGGKGKGKKFTTSDEIAKKLVEQDVAPSTGSTRYGQSSSSTDSGSSKKKSEESKDDKGGNDMDMNYRFKDDDEWTDFHDDSQKDYSGLKVQALQITDDPGEGEEDEEEVDENGEPIKSKGQGQSGPWNKNTEQVQPSQAVAAPAAQEPEPPKEEPKPAASTGKYIPPSKRAAAAAASSQVASGPSAAAQRMGRKGKAPQINSEFEFPTLAASSELVKHSNKGEDATFSTVTRGGQAVDNASSRGPDLELGNRYAALGGN
ncbi:protein CDV3 homolog [Diadema setosum]|uniref:protein CDV3 homolog n=1 Tax=Diadema setosum TaxID=31175 RepID=UPI003B3BB05D